MFRHKTFKEGKCKTQLSLVVARIKVVRGRHDAMVRQSRKDVAICLQQGKEETARQKVELAIREQNKVEVLNLIEKACAHLIAQLPVLSQKTCPSSLHDPVATIIYAGSRMGELPELPEVRAMLASKFGKEFVDIISELRPGNPVNKQLVHFLSTDPPNRRQKFKVMEEICAEHDVQWKAPREDQHKEHDKSGISVPNEKNKVPVQPQHVKEELSSNLHAHHISPTVPNEKNKVPLQSQHVKEEISSNLHAHHISPVEAQLQTRPTSSSNGNGKEDNHKPQLNVKENMVYNFTPSAKYPSLHQPLPSVETSEVPNSTSMDSSLKEAKRELKRRGILPDNSFIDKARLATESVRRVPTHSNTESVRRVPTHSKEDEMFHDFAIAAEEAAFAANAVADLLNHSQLDSRQVAILGLDKPSKQQEVMPDSGISSHDSMKPRISNRTPQEQMMQHPIVEHNESESLPIANESIYDKKVSGPIEHFLKSYTSDAKSFEGDDDWDSTPNEAYRRLNSNRLHPRDPLFSSSLRSTSNVSMVEQEHCSTENGKDENSFHGVQTLKPRANLNLQDLNLLDEHFPRESPEQSTSFDNESTSESEDELDPINYTTNASAFGSTYSFGDGDDFESKINLAYKRLDSDRLYRSNTLYPPKTAEQTMAFVPEVGIGNSEQTNLFSNPNSHSESLFNVCQVEEYHETKLNEIGSDLPVFDDYEDGGQPPKSPESICLEISKNSSTINVNKVQDSDDEKDKVSVGSSGVSWDRSLWSKRTRENRKTLNVNNVDGEQGTFGSSEAGSLWNKHTQENRSTLNVNNSDDEQDKESSESNRVGSLWNTHTGKNRSTLNVNNSDDEQDKESSGSSGVGWDRSLWNVRKREDSKSSNPRTSDVKNRKNNFPREENRSRWNRNKQEDSDNSDSHALEEETANIRAKPSREETKIFEVDTSVTRGPRKKWSLHKLEEGINLYSGHGSDDDNANMKEEKESPVEVRDRSKWRAADKHASPESVVGHISNLEKNDRAKASDLVPNVNPDSPGPKRRVGESVRSRRTIRAGGVPR